MHWQVDSQTVPISTSNSAQKCLYLLKFICCLWVLILDEGRFPWIPLKDSKLLKHQYFELISILNLRRIHSKFLSGNSRWRWTRFPLFLRISSWYLSLATIAIQFKVLFPKFLLLLLKFIASYFSYSYSFTFLKIQPTLQVLQALHFYH